MTTATHEPPDLSIRTKPPSPRRLSRKVLLAGVLIAGAVIAFALVTGLSERPDRRANANDTASATTGGPPESIRGASEQYAAHDLGGLELKPPGDVTLLEDSDELEPPSDPVWSNASAAAAPPAERDAPDPQAIARTSSILFASARPRGDGEADDARLKSRLTPPRSRYEIKSGDTIAAALVTALNSDLPGRIVAQVTAPVYDSVTGQHLLIPQGARLIGAYDNGTAYGDHRLLLVWNRLVLPNGWSINLREMSATDPTGAAGLADKTDNHLDSLGAAIALSSIVSVVANEAEDRGDDARSLARGVGDAAAQQAAETGGRIIDRELKVRPTLTVRAGAPVRVLVARDIELRPYIGAPAPR